MKTAPKTKKASNSNSHSSKPFFNKSGEGSFFSQSKESEPPFFTPAIQPKLTIGQPGDKYEQEADTMAEKVVQKLDTSNSSPVIQNKCDDCEQEEKVQKMEDEEMTISKKPIFESDDSINNKLIQGKGIDEVDPSIETQLQNSKGSGQPLDKRTRQNMEQSFGADFTGVKVHTGNNAIQMNQSLGAQAFTNGSDIYFNQNKYNPNTKNGNKLLAHELTHVIQQNSSNDNEIVHRQSSERTSNSNITEVIQKIELALTVAGQTLNNPEFSGDKKSKIASLTVKLTYVLEQLKKNEEQVVLGFDPSPEKNEINLGDASKSVEELYQGADPNTYFEETPLTSGGAEDRGNFIQLKLNEISISNADESSIQMFCDPIICGAIIVLGGLLLSGCSNSSSSSGGGASLSQKKVKVNITFLEGGSTSLATHLTKANDVFKQASVKVEEGTKLTINETDSKAILGVDLILDEFSSPYTPTAEETELFKKNRDPDTITMYYVKGMSAGSLGEAFFPSTGNPVGFVYASSNSRTWPHELGHILLDTGGHPRDADNFMAQTSVASGKEKMTPSQITTIRSSKYVK